MKKCGNDRSYPMVDVKIENSVLKKENEALKNDIVAIEKIVMPGKITASCEEYRNRGETETGIYQIKPTMDIEPFSVSCDFRKWCLILAKKFSKKKTENILGTIGTARKMQSR